MRSIADVCRVKPAIALWRASADVSVESEVVSDFARLSTRSMPASTASRTWSSTRIAIPLASTLSDVKKFVMVFRYPGEEGAADATAGAPAEPSPEDIASRKVGGGA